MDAIEPMPAANDEVFRVVQIDQVSYDFASASASLVLREAEGERRALTLPVALNDATAIHQAWHHVMGRRPATNELMIYMLQELQADVIAARIVKCAEGIYYGELDLMTTRGRRVFDCRPSDAITLALRQVVPAPILAAEELLWRD